MNVYLIDENNQDAFQKLLTKEAFHGFTHKLGVFCLGAVCDGVAVGALAGYPDGEVFRIISLFVAPSFRRKGAATKLMDTLEATLKGEVSTISIRFSATDPELESLCSFFESREYLKDDRGGKNIYLAPMSEVSEILSEYREKLEPHKHSDELLRFSTLSPEHLHEVKKQASEHHAPIPEGGIDGKNVEADLSYVLFKDNELLGYCLIDDSVLGLPTIAALWTRESHTLAVAHMLYKSLHRVTEKKYDEPYLAMMAVTDTAVTLVRKYLPQAMGISYTYYRTVGRR